MVPATGSSHVTRTGRRENALTNIEASEQNLLNPDALSLTIAHISYHKYFAVFKLIHPADMDGP